MLRHMDRVAIFLEGPIGSGKTTLGRALAPRLSGRFLDGDDYSDAGRPWHGSILTTSRAIVEAGLRVLEDAPVVVIAYPLRCTNWIYFRRRFAAAGVRTVFVSLDARWETIVDPSRGRSFDGEERARIREMIAQGYGRRPFSDLRFATDRTTVEEGAVALHAALARILAS